MTLLKLIQESIQEEFIFRKYKIKWNELIDEIKLWGKNC